MAKTELERRFARAVWLIRNGPPKEGTSTDEKLKFYGYFKQATLGDCTEPQPWAVQVRGWAQGPCEALPGALWNQMVPPRQRSDQNRPGGVPPPPPLPLNTCLPPLPGRSLRLAPSGTRGASSRA